MTDKEINSVLPEFSTMMLFKAVAEAAAAALAVAILISMEEAVAAFLVLSKCPQMPQ